MKWQRIAWLHLPAVVWGAFVEFSGWICPLTPLENWLRAQGGETSYRSDFIAQYLLPVLYPGDLTRDLQRSSSIPLSIGGSGEYKRVERLGVDTVRRAGECDQPS